MKKYKLQLRGTSENFGIFFIIGLIMEYLRYGELSRIDSL